MICSAIASLQNRFLAIVPRIKIHGRVYFRDLKCPDQKREAIAEMLGLAWRWFNRLCQQGKDPMLFPSAIATFAAKQVRSGRRLCGQEKAKDVLSPLAQRRHGFTVDPLPERSTLSGSTVEDALRDNMQSPIPDQVAFRLDFPRWRKTYPRRDRRLLDSMMVGEPTQALASRFGLTPARISQKRREFHEDWQSFCEDLED